MTEHGDFIRLTREAKGMSQRELAKLTGHSNAYIAKIEVGRQRGSWATLVKMADALDVPARGILRKAGFPQIPTTPVESLMGKDVEEFAEMDGATKSVLLEIAPIIAKYLSRVRTSAEWFGEHKKLLKKRGK
jgi:transcriptional regulator with XRE-family HTH domain